MVKEIYPFILEGKVIRTVDTEKISYWQKEKIEYAKNENEKLTRKKEELINQKNELEQQRTEKNTKLELLLAKERLTKDQDNEKNILIEELKVLDKKLGTSSLIYHPSEIETWEGQFEEMKDGEIAKEIENVDTEINKNDEIINETMEERKRDSLLGAGNLFYHPSEIETWEGQFEEVIDGEIPKRIENIDMVINKNDEIINQTLEETKNIGVEVDFDEDLKKQGQMKRDTYPNFRETVEAIENGVYSAEMMGENGVKVNTDNTDKQISENDDNSSEKEITVKNEYFYAYEILSNSGYSKGNSTTLLPKPEEKILIAFFSNRNFSFGTLSNENKENIKNEIIKFNTNQMQMQADKNIDYLTMKKVMYSIYEAGGGPINFAVSKDADKNDAATGAQTQ